MNRDPRTTAAPSPQPPQQNPGSDPINRLWAVLGAVATIAGLITFIALDVPDILRGRDGGEQQALPFPTAQPGEILVLVTGFTEQGVEVDTRLFRTLRDRVAADGLPVRVEHLPTAIPTLPEEIQPLAEQSGATLIIWGTADSLSFEPQISLRDDIAYRRVETQAVLAADLALYSAYIVHDAPAEFEYLLLLVLGQIALRNDDIAGAHGYFDAALLAVNPERLQALNAGPAYFYRGYTASQLGDPAAARDDYGQAISLDPSLIEAYSNRALLLARVNELDAALADADQAIALNERIARNWRVRGYLRLLAADWQGAVSDLDRALELQPGSADALNNRAYARARMGEDLALALDDVAAAIEIDPARATYYDTQGLVLLQQGDSQGAIAAYQQALALEPPELSAWFGLGQAYEAAGQRVLAIDAYRRYLENNPSGRDRSAAEERITTLGG